MRDPIDFIIDRLRERDMEEIFEMGLNLDQVSRVMHAGHAFAQLWCSPVTHDPACMMWFQRLSPRALIVNMLATDAFDHVARQVYRDVKRTILPHLLQRGFERAECRTMEGHDDAIRFLDHLGFKREARFPRYGQSGRAFLQYAWSLDDHFHEGTAPFEQSFPQRPRRGARANGQI